MGYAERTPRIFTAEEYLMIERDAPYKSEFFHGAIITMSGASTTHVDINVNLIAAIRIRLRGSDCRGLNNDMKVRTFTKGLFAYPDAGITCGERIFHDTRNDVLLNPVALFEILSPSTEAVDRGEKLLNYRELESLRDYLLISQNAPRIEHYARNENNEWIPSITLGLGAEITLTGLPLTLPLSEIYEDIIFPPALTLAVEDE